MPLVIDNENVDEIIARFVFDKNLFTIFFRRASCGIGAEGEDLCVKFNKDQQLRKHNPQVIINDVDPRHRHFQAFDKKLVHVHVGFNSSIEYFLSVKSILIATSEIQKDVFEIWSALEKSYKTKFESPICGSILFSNLDNMLMTANYYFSQKNLYSENNNLCFWNKKNGQMQLLDCKDLITDIPTESDILDNMRSIIIQSQTLESSELKKTSETNTNEETYAMQETQVMSYGKFELILLLIACFWLLKNLPRPIINSVGLRR